MRKRVNSREKDCAIIGKLSEIRAPMVINASSQVARKCGDEDAHSAIKFCDIAACPGTTSLNPRIRGPDLRGDQSCETIARALLAAVLIPPTLGGAALAQREPVAWRRRHASLPRPRLRCLARRPLVPWARMTAVTAGGGWSGGTGISIRRPSIPIPTLTCRRSLRRRGADVMVLLRQSAGILPLCAAMHGAVAADAGASDRGGCVAVSHATLNKRR